MKMLKIVKFNLDDSEGLFNLRASWRNEFN